MRQLLSIIFLTLLISTPAFAISDGNQLEKYCEEVDIKDKSSSNYFASGACLGYLQAVMASLTRTAENKICPPENGISVDQARKIVLKNLKNHPETLHEHPYVIISASLLVVFPCVK